MEKDWATTGNSKMKRLSNKQLDFCNYYIESGNGEKSAIRAGYKQTRARSTASRLLTRPHVKKYIEKFRSRQIKRFEITADKVLQEVAISAFSNIANFYNDDMSLKKLSELSEDDQKAISELECRELYDEDIAIGKIKKLKLNCKTKSLELLGKYFKLWTDKKIVEGGDEPLQVKVSPVNISQMIDNIASE